MVPPKRSFRLYSIVLSSLKHQAIQEQRLARLMLQVLSQVNNMTYVELWLELTSFSFIKN